MCDPSISTEKYLHTLPKISQKDFKSSVGTYANIFRLKATLELCLI